MFPLDGVVETAVLWKETGDDKSTAIKIRHRQARRVPTGARHRCKPSAALMTLVLEKPQRPRSGTPAPHITGEETRAHRAEAMCPRPQ